MPDVPDAVKTARKRRGSGTVMSFDGSRLSIACRLRRLPRTNLAAAVGVTPAAITQFERGQTRPTRVTLNALALALGMPQEYFLQGERFEPVPSAHFRSLRATPAISREQALAFSELSFAVVKVIERYVDFPELNIPMETVGFADLIWPRFADLIWPHP